jgi:hypothetical protein
MKHIYLNLKRFDVPSLCMKNPQQEVCILLTEGFSLFIAKVYNITI